MPTTRFEAFSIAWHAFVALLQQVGCHQADMTTALTAWNSVTGYIEDNPHYIKLLDKTTWEELMKELEQLDIAAWAMLSEEVGKYNPNSRQKEKAADFIHRMLRAAWPTNG